MKVRRTHIWISYTACALQYNIFYFPAWVHVKIKIYFVHTYTPRFRCCGTPALPPPLSVLAFTDLVFTVLLPYHRSKTSTPLTPTAYLFPTTQYSTAGVGSAMLHVCRLLGGRRALRTKAAVPPGRDLLCGGENTRTQNAAERATAQLVVSVLGLPPVPRTGMFLELTI